MDETLTTFASTAVPPRNKPVDPRADPKYWGYTWTNWCDFVQVNFIFQAKKIFTKNINFTIKCYLSLSQLVGK